MNNQGFPDDPQMGSARDYYPELKPFDQHNSGKMLMHMMREEFVTLQKFRKLAMNIIESTNLGHPLPNRYIGVTFQGTPNNGVIHNVTLKDLQSGEAGRDGLTIEEIQWGLKRHIFENVPNSNTNDIFNINLTTLTQELYKAQTTIDRLGSGLSLFTQGFDYVTNRAMKSTLRGVSPSDDLSVRR